MVKIDRHKHIQGILTALNVIGFVIAFIIVYFVIGKYTLTSFAILMGVIIGWTILSIIVYLGLRALKWGYYLIDNNGIKFFNKSDEVFDLKIGEIGSIYYTRWTLWQMAGGYLCVDHSSEQEELVPYTQVIPALGIRRHCISMSLKQAQEIGKLLGKQITVK